MNKTILKLRGKRWIDMKIYENKTYIKELICKGLGALLILDALLSLVVVSDKMWIWQLGRVVRLLIGIYFLVI
jgi:hypothetical protein